MMNKQDDEREKKNKNAAEPNLTRIQTDQSDLYPISANNLHSLFLL